MRRLSSIAPLLLLVLAAVIWFVFVSEPFSKWLAKVTNRATYNGHVVGRLVRSEGSSRILHLGDIRLAPTPMEKPIELRDGTQIQTSVDSKAIFVLNSQDEFELGPSGLVQIQLWNSRDPSSPAYITNSLGQLKLQKAGAKGKAYVIRDGRLYLPGQAVVTPPMALTVLRSAPLDLALADQSSASTDDGESDSLNAADSSAEDEESAAPLATGLDPETLSNEYIDEVISRRQSLLQRCWLSRIKDAPTLKGNIILQFEISRRGKVRDIRVIDATLDDDTLTKCVISVFSRIAFRPYKGPEISLSYPITFE